MKKFNLFLGGLMAIAFTACTNEDFMQEGNSNAPSAEKITITAYTPGDNSASSRIAQGDYEIGQTIPLTWDNDDQISVFYAGITKTYTKSGEDKNTFTGDIFPEIEGFYYGFYPALAADVVEGNVPFDLSDQTGADTYLMCARSEVHNSYQFHHAAAYLKATFPETLKNTTATITLTVPEGVYTKGTIDLDNFTLEPNNEYKNIISKTVEFGTSTDVWFALPPMAANNNTLNFTIKTANNNYRATLEGSAEKAIEAGNYYSATIDMVEGLTTCNFIKGQDFYSAIASYSNIKSIVFNANSTRSTSGAKNLTNYNGSNANAFAKFEEGVLYIYTTANEFVFHQYSQDMFKYRREVEVINFNNCINTSNVTNMYEMFKECNALTSLDLSSFNTSKVTDMGEMFYNCKALTSLDLCNFIFKDENVVVYNMFYGCDNVENIYVRDEATKNNLTYYYRFSSFVDKYTSLFTTHNHQ